MKLRFIINVTSLTAEMRVKTMQELHTLIRIKLKLGNDHDLVATLRIRPYTEFLNPKYSWNNNYEVFLVGRGAIGFCDSTLTSLTPLEEGEVQLEDGPFSIDTKNIEHACCYSASIMFTADEKSEPVRYSECAAANARFVCNALNIAWKKNHV